VPVVSRTAHHRSTDRGRAGFSIVELVLALIVAGVLVGMAVPLFRGYTHRYRVASMVSALRRFAAAQEAYWRDVGSYSAAGSVLRYEPTHGVTVTPVSADSLGWSARATFDGDPTVCAIYYGDAPILPPATRRNVIGCSQ